MCAMMPMFRVFSSEYCRSTSRPCFLDSVVSARYMRRGGSAYGPPLGSALRLPAIVSERLVGLRHLVRVLTLLHGGATVVRGVEQLGGELLGHRALGTAPRGADDPPHRQRRPSVGTHLDRHLVGRAADPPRLHLDGRLHVVDGRFEHLQRILLGPVLDRRQGVVHDPLRRRLLAADHHDVHELRNEARPVLRVRQHLAPRGARPSHGLRPPCLGRLGAVLRATLLPPGDARGVEGPADDVVPDPGEVLDAATPDHHDRVLLEVVADARDVRGHLEAVGEPHPSDLPESRVRLLRRRRVDADTDAALLRARLHRGRLRLLPHRLATPSDQLVNGRHDSPSPETVAKPSLYNRGALTCQRCSHRSPSYEAAATLPSASPVSATGGGVSESMLSSVFTASPPGVNTSTRV